MVTVTVPATSANVGAGFDSLGLAVSMHNVFTFEESDRIQISSVDGTHVPAGSNNLVYRSARVVYDQLGIPLKGLRITQRIQSAAIFSTCSRIFSLSKGNL